MKNELEKAENLLLNDIFRKNRANDDGVDYTVDESNEELQKAENLLLGDIIRKSEFSEKERKDLAKRKLAMSDGSYPIRNVSDLKNAIQAFGRTGSNKSETKFWIKRRAKELGKESLLPDTWKSNNVDLFEGEGDSNKLMKNMNKNRILKKSYQTEDLFEKAHSNGEMHPNGKWIWNSSANGGKGDWRVKKTSNTSKTEKKEIGYSKEKFLSKDLIPKLDPLQKNGNIKILNDVEKRLGLSEKGKEQREFGFISRDYEVSGGKLIIWADHEEISHKYEATEHFYTYGVVFRKDKRQVEAVFRYYDDKWECDEISDLNKVVTSINKQVIK